jgi:phosphatidylserine/phosphatidylglycerophosphate/cardiolipin synthase-like enzyme
MCVWTVAFSLAASPVRAGDTLCDPSVNSCRAQLLSLIQNERVGIDVGYWFMTDVRYANAIVLRWQAGVPVRILMDPRANPENPGNDQIIAQFTAAGIPLRTRAVNGIMHWKAMIFAGQDVVEFGSANYSPAAFVPVTPYTNYVAETVFVTSDPALVGSFKTKFDNYWTSTNAFADYANVVQRTRVYPTFPSSPELNFPPEQSYVSRAVTAYNAETRAIDAIVFRVTDRKHTDAMIAARNRGVAVRLIIDRQEYRSTARLWDAWNVDRMYVAGIPIRWQGHIGDNHEKLVLLHAQQGTIFGSSNWTSSSSNAQAEHNMFTTRAAIFAWFAAQFDRMWFNKTGLKETVAFTPLPPDIPSRPSPANGAAVSVSPVTLKWYGGPWAHVYDLYFGTTSPPPLIAANLPLGPSESSTQKQSQLSPSLVAGRTYYWRVVSKTMANKTASSPIWSFTR